MTQDKTTYISNAVTKNKNNLQDKWQEIAVRREPNRRRIQLGNKMRVLRGALSHLRFSSNEKLSYNYAYGINSKAIEKFYPFISHYLISLGCNKNVDRYFRSVF